MHHNATVVGGVTIFHMAFVFLQQSDLLLWETYYGYKGEFISFPRQTKRQPFVLGLSAAMTVCVLDSS